MRASWTAGVVGIQCWGTFGPRLPIGSHAADAELCSPDPLSPLPKQEALARALGALPQDAFELAVGLVMAHHPGLQPYDDFVFDLDALDALTLRQMQVGAPFWVVLSD